MIYSGVFLLIEGRNSLYFVSSNQIFIILGGEGGPFPLLGAWETQLGRNVATVASHGRHCANLTGQGIEPKTYRIDSVHLTTGQIGSTFHNRCNEQVIDGTHIYVMYLTPADLTFLFYFVILTNPIVDSHVTSEAATRIEPKTRAALSSIPVFLDPFLTRPKFV